MPSITDYIYDKLASYVLRNSPDRDINLEAAARQTGTQSLSSQTTPVAQSLRSQGLKDWVLAIAFASDPEEPNRTQLRDLYANLELDNHLMATIGNRVDAVRSSPFKLVDKSGNENPEATALLQKLWFMDQDGFVDLALKSRYKGTTVLELFDLKEDGQLKQVTALDMAHVIPQKGLIVKEPGDTNGWPYKEGNFANYYLQIGRDNYLGLFAELAPIVLAKKLGVGSWLDYVEKFGIPPIFVFTDRYDKKRLDELYAAMVNFKSNQFLIGQGNEKIEIGNNNGNSNSAVFRDLAELANKEISKRINGGTGTTDEKSFVGSAEVHSNILKTKIKLDKFFIQVLVNEELIPRLAALSPVYSSLPNFTFEWDESEDLNLQEYLTNVVALSANYTFDVEQLAEKTGMPIVGIKNELGVPETTEKKKTRQNLSASLTAFYPPFNKELNADLSDYEKVIAQIARDMHAGKLKTEDLSKELVNQIYTDLSSAASEGWGKDFLQFGDSLEKDRTVLAMQRNLFRFSGAKSYAQLVEFNGMLTDGNKLRSQQEFINKVLEKNKTYNRNYLQAEFQTARQASNHARNWQQYQKQKDVYPNLEYRTVNDGRVRQEHQGLHGVVKPVNDPFWDRFYPPNGWRCRCFVKQTRATATQATPDDPTIKPEFRINTGKTGTVFSDTHPYFRVLPEKVNEEVEKRFIKQASNELRKRLKEKFVEPKVEFEFKVEDSKEKLNLSNRDINTIIRKPHKDRIGRLEVLYNLKNQLKTAEYFGSYKEDKGRDDVYIEWFYFKSKEGDFFFNIVKLGFKEYKLHAITDKLKKL